MDLLDLIKTALVTAIATMAVISTTVVIEFVLTLKEHNK